jgi:Phage T7 tail fibre protein.
MALIGQLADPNYRYSINEFTGTGLQVNWEINFAGGYIDRSHVKAVVLDLVGNVTPRDLAWAGDSTVVINPPVPEGHKLTIYRETPKVEPLADFVDAAVINEVNLDRNARQAVFIAAEALDRGEGALGEIAPRAIMVPVGEQAPGWPVPSTLRGKFVTVDFDGRIVGKNFLGGAGVADTSMLEHNGGSLHDFLTDQAGDIGQIAEDLTTAGESLIEQALRDDELDSRLANLRTDHDALVSVVDAFTDFAEGADEGLATMIVNETSARTTADAAMAATIGLIGAKSPDGLAFILDTDSVKVDEDATLADRFFTMDAATDTLEVQIEDETQARIAGDIAEASARSSLAATLRGETAAAVQTEATARVDADNAEATARTQLAATLREETTAAISAEQTARANGDAAEASARASLAATLRGETSALIQSEETARVNGDNALASTFNLMGAKNGAGTAFILDSSKVFVDGSTSLATRLSGIDSSMGANSSAIANEVTARTSAVSAVASNLSALSATVGGHTGTINTLSSVQADHTGYITSLYATYGLTINIDGFVSGWRLHSNGTTGSMIVDVDSFALGRKVAGTNQFAFPFQMIGTDVFIKSAHIQSASITNAHIQNLSVDTFKIAGSAVSTEKIAPEAVSASIWATLGSSAVLTKFIDNMVLSVSVPDVQWGEVLRFDANFSLYSDNDLTGQVIVRHVKPDGYTYDLRRQQTKLDSDGNTATYLTLPVRARAVADQPGTHTFLLGFYPSGGASNFSAVAGTDLEVTRQKR